MGILSKLKPHNGPSVTEAFFISTYDIKPKVIEKHMTTDPFFDTVTTDDFSGKLLRVSRYDDTAIPARLSYDKKTGRIKILVSGKTVGTVVTDQTATVKKILDTALVENVAVLASGGAYKVVAQNDITTMSDDISAKLQITYKR